VGAVAAVSLGTAVRRGGTMIAAAGWRSATAAAQGGMVRHGESEPKQADDGADQALRLAQGQAEHGPERQRRQHRQRGIPGLPARGRARLGPPGLDGFAGEPDRQAATLAQAGVIRAPVHELVLLLGNRVAVILVQLERQYGYPRSGQGAASHAEPVPDATGQVRATRSVALAKAQQASVAR